ncbi:MAG: foldase protein PrsA, partial [Candidatus Marinamargulisbacteria bacterium]
MIRFFRNHAAAVGWAIVLFFGGTMFTGALFFGASSGDSKAEKRQVDTSRELAVVGTIPVDRRQYLDSLTRIQQEVLRSGVQTSPAPELIELMQFTAFNQALQFTLLLQGAEGQKMKPSKQKMQRTLNSVYEQYDVKNKKGLKVLLAKNNVKFSEVENLVEDQVLVQQFAEFLQSQANVTDRDVDNQYSEVNVRHILIKSDTSGENEDVVQELIKIQKEVSAGLSFKAAALKYSQDEGTKKEGGSLGWIKVGMTVKPFEEVAFALSKGELSKPTKSPFGYHLIQVTGRRSLKRPDGFDLVLEKEEILAAMKDRAIQDYVQNILTRFELKINDPWLSAYNAKMEG